MIRLRSRTSALLAILLFASLAAAQKRTVGFEDAKKWEVLGGYDISRDGRWLTYSVSPVDGDGRVVVKNNDSPQVWTIPNGSRGVFSDDSKWAACLVSPPKAVADKLREEKKPVETKLALRDLSTGNERTLDSVQRFQFLKGSRTLLIHRFRGASKQEGGSDLTLLDLAGGETLTIGNVVDAIPNHEGTTVALEIQSDSGDKGVQLVDPATFRIRTLAWGKDEVSSLAWNKGGDTLAFLLGKTDEKKEGAANRVVIATNLNEKPVLKQLDPAAAEGFPKDRRIAEAPLAISDDGSIVGFGVADWVDKKKPSKPGEKSAPEIWNSKDLRTVPEQRVSAAADRNRIDHFVWRPASGTWRQIDDGPLQSSMPLEGLKKAVLIDRKPYASAVTNGWAMLDVYIVDTETGLKTKVLEKTHSQPIPSRKGKYLAYYMGRRWCLYDVEANRHLDPLKNVKTTFEDAEDDHTVPEKPPADFPDWLANDTGFIVGDDYDCWLVRTDTLTATSLTEGRKDHVMFRFTQVEDEEEGPRIDKPLTFTVFDEDLKASGYYVCDAAGKGKIVALDNLRMSGLRKAKDADRVVLRMEDWNQSPNLYITNMAFSQIKPETSTNPQQKEFLWGKTELIKYKSRWGKALSGVLIYPADYQAGRKYPMVTYIYERLSQNLHGYQAPVEYSAYNAQWLSQNGYFVYMPDIAYKGRTPGQNAVDCLEPAVEAVFAKHVGVDPDRVGLMGHSWGGYQTAFVTTVSKMFKVGVAGAPLTDLTSMYNTHYWNVGITNQVLLETGQGRLEVPLWEDPKTYIENSPVWQSKKRTAPILVTVGDQDGAVDYHQGIALYNTLRRMGKDCVLLVYYGENHNFTKRPDQLDYAKRVRHYLDVYLKGAKPEPWVSEGVPFIHRED